LCPLDVSETGSGVHRDSRPVGTSGVPMRLEREANHSPISSTISRMRRVMPPLSKVFPSAAITLLLRHFMFRLIHAVLLAKTHQHLWCQIWRRGSSTSSLLNCTFLVSAWTNRNQWLLLSKRTIPTERPRLVGEI
jgi:hypothetical protein